jgi:hypothetical protein
VQAPITVTDVTPALYEDTCPLTPDGGPAETIYRGIVATSEGTTLLLQLGAIDNYCRTQCGQTCVREAMASDNLSGVAGILLVAPRGTTPDLFIRPSRPVDVQFP